MIRAAQTGDPAAFDALVRAHGTAVYNFLRSVGATDLDAEDLAQEVFVRAHRALPRFRGDCSLRTWLFSVAINLTRSQRAFSRRRRPVWEDSGEGTDASVMEQHPDGADLEHGVVQRQLIRRALASLPWELRAAIVLRDVQGMEYGEIAEVLAVPIGTVESRVFRARRRLRPMLAELLAHRQ